MRWAKFIKKNVEKFTENNERFSDLTCSESLFTAEKSTERFT